MEIRCEMRGKEAMKEEESRWCETGEKTDARIEGGVQEDEGAEEGSFLLQSVSHFVGIKTVFCSESNSFNAQPQNGWHKKHCESTKFRVQVVQSSSGLGTF